MAGRLWVADGGYRPKASDGGRTNIAQSVLSLAMGWTVQESNPGVDEIFCTRSDGP
jgi:hypothetical protein